MNYPMEKNPPFGIRSLQIYYTKGGGFFYLQYFNRQNKVLSIFFGIIPYFFLYNLS
jgi:hypothetical protein